MGSTREVLIRRLPGAILAGWLLVVLATVGAVASPNVRRWLGLTSSSHAYRIGEQIDTSPQTYQDASSTVLVFARASCRGCQAAKPVLSGLVSDLRSTRVAVRVLAPSVNPSDQLAYVRSLGLPDESLVPVNFRQLRLRVIPTAVHVDERGRILDVSEGGESLERFADAVRSATGSR